MARYRWSVVLATACLLVLGGCPVDEVPGDTDGTTDTPTQVPEPDATVADVEPPGPDAAPDADPPKPDGTVDATPDTPTVPDTAVEPDADTAGPEVDTAEDGEAAPVDADDIGPAPECLTDADCQHLAEPCVLGACTDGACAATLDTCDDDDTCTEDSCEVETGCQHVYDAMTCEGAAVAYTTTVDDAANVLGGVVVLGTDDALLSDLDTGRVTLTHTAGAYVWEFTAEGYLPVWRSATVAQGEVLAVTTPWLHPRNPAAGLATTAEPTTVTSQDLSVIVAVCWFALLAQSLTFESWLRRMMQGWHNLPLRLLRKYLYKFKY